MSDGVELAAPTPTPEPKPNSFSRLGGIIFAPAETFSSIVRRPDFALPLIIALVAALFFGVVAANRVDFVAGMREQMESMPNASKMPPDAIEKQARLMGGFMRAAFYFAPVTAAISLIIVAAILFAVFKIFGGEGDFMQAYAITVYSSIPTAIKNLLAAVALLARKSASVELLKNPLASNIGYFLDPLAHPIARAFFTMFDVFIFWMLFLMIVGFAAMSRFSRAKTAAILLTIWAFIVLLVTAGGAIQALRMKAK